MKAFVIINWMFYRKLNLPNSFRCSTQEYLSYLLRENLHGNARKGEIMLMNTEFSKSDAIRLVGAKWLF